MPALDPCNLLARRNPRRRVANIAIRVLLIYTYIYIFHFLLLRKMKNIETFGIEITLDKTFFVTYVESHKLMDILISVFHLLLQKMKR